MNPGEDELDSEVGEANGGRSALTPLCSPIPVSPRHQFGSTFLGPPNLAFDEPSASGTALSGINSENSAFRRISTASREKLSPGVEFTPSRKPLYEHLTVRKASSSGQVPVQQDKQQSQSSRGMGAFEHHVPFSTPFKLHSRGIHDDSSMPPSPDYFSAGPPSPDLMGLVSQVVHEQDHSLDVSLSRPVDQGQFAYSFDSTFASSHKPLSQQWNAAGPSSLGAPLAQHTAAAHTNQQDGAYWDQSSIYNTRQQFPYPAQHNQTGSIAAHPFETFPNTGSQYKQYWEQSQSSLSALSGQTMGTHLGGLQGMYAPDGRETQQYRHIQHQPQAQVFPHQHHMSDPSLRAAPMASSIYSQNIQTGPPMLSQSNMGQRNPVPVSAFGHVTGDFSDASSFSGPGQPHYQQHQYQPQFSQQAQYSSFPQQLQHPPIRSAFEQTQHYGPSEPMYSNPYTGMNTSLPSQYAAVRRPEHGSQYGNEHSHRTWPGPSHSLDRPAGDAGAHGLPYPAHTLQHPSYPLYGKDSSLYSQDHSRMNDREGTFGNTMGGTIQHSARQRLQPPSVGSSVASLGSGSFSSVSSASAMSSSVQSSNGNPLTTSSYAPSLAVGHGHSLIKDTTEGPRGKDPPKPRPKKESQKPSRPVGAHNIAAATAFSGMVVPVQTESNASSPRPTRREQAESPSSKLVYKEFNKTFRSLERDSLDEARNFALESLESTVPDKVRWKILIDLADLVKRNNEIDEARKYYQQCVELQPLAYQGWMEWSKMEEECGRVSESLRVLRLGLEKCDLHEGLLTKAIKQQEKLHRLKDARGMLSKLKNEPVERYFRTMLEGALIEARAGQLQKARALLKYLISSVPWYGPIHYEAYKLEEKNDQITAAKKIVQRGLIELPRYGPLWFGLLRLTERDDYYRAAQQALSISRPIRLTSLHTEASNAVKHISKELVWKVFFDLAMAEERAVEHAVFGILCRGASPHMVAAFRNAHYGNVRIALVRAFLACPGNLRWKVLLLGARMEIAAGCTDRARQSLCQAFKEVPSKARANVYLECSRIEEYVGNLEAAKRILIRSCRDVGHEWKVCLELVSLYARAGDLFSAARVAEEALKMHPGAGRIWAALVQVAHRLESTSISPASFRPHSGTGFPESGLGTSPIPSSVSDRVTAIFNGAMYTTPTSTAATSSASLNAIPTDQPTAAAAYMPPSIQSALLRALREVPKSGEVWCESARCRLNPLVPSRFDPAGAQKFLSFAIQFTPQYGDSFVESLRLEVMLQALLPAVLGILGVPVGWFLRKFLLSDAESDAAIAISEPAGLIRMARLADRAGRKHSPGSVATAAASPSHLDLGSSLFPAPAPASLRKSRQRVLEEAVGHGLSAGVCIDDLKNVALSSLNRRCINADPNYGYSWCFSRTPPYDSPPSAIIAAHNALAQELMSVEPVYVKALCVFVKRCVEKGLDGMVERGIEISDASPSTPSTSAAPSSSPDPIVESDLQPLYTCSKTCLVELLQDFDQAAASFSTTNVWEQCIPILTINSPRAMFSHTDFITASIKMNRLGCDTAHTCLSPEDRRKVLFACDAILP